MYVDLCSSRRTSRVEPSIIGTDRATRSIFDVVASVNVFPRPVSWRKVGYLVGSRVFFLSLLHDFLGTISTMLCPTCSALVVSNRFIRVHSHRLVLRMIILLVECLVSRR